MLTGLATVRLGAHFARKLNRAAEQQDFLGQRGFARVGVGDDGEGAPARDRVWGGHGGQALAWERGERKGVGVRACSFQANN